MAVGFSNTNKPLNPRGQDASPKGYNRASLFSGKALDFDGVNDEVNIGAISGSFTDYTLSWYIQTSTTQNFSSIFTNENSEADWYITSAGQLRVYSGAGDETTTLEPLNDGKLKHVVASISGDQLSVYINGALGQTISYSRTSAFTINASRIGRLYNGGYPYDGLIAGFKFFNTALTAEQVADLYNNPEKVVPTGLESNLKLWLPMMEGAGTTAYDGSGNGNHGTISGATYVNGIGAPVAQSAVMDWNKGSNLFPYSNDYSQSNWNKPNATIVANSGTSPDGSNNASLLYATSNGSISYINDVLTQSSAVYTISAFVKASGRNICWIYIQGGATYGNAYFDLSDQSTQVSTGSSSTLTATITSVGNDWYKISATTGEAISITSGCGIGISDAKGSLNVTADGTNGILVYGLHIHSGSVSPYVPTLATAQTSEVLLPQGLTTGRDITGVNLFENVRKQGALNLDGNSWAEVHDNESLDITSAITLEAWVYWDGVITNAGILGRYFSGAASYMLYANATDALFFTNSSSSSVTISGTGWKHIVGTYDGTTRKMFVDGAQIGVGAAYSTPLSVTTDPVEIGRYSGDPSGSKSFKNDIAQPRIYNRALTASEVLQNYNSGKNTYK